MTEQLNLFGLQEHTLLSPRNNREQSIPFIEMKSLELAQGRYMRTVWGEVLPVTKISKPQRYLMASIHKKNREGKTYLIDKFHEVVTVMSCMVNCTHLTLSDHVTLVTECPIDCVYPGDKVMLKDGSICAISGIRRGRVYDQKIFEIFDCKQIQKVKKISHTILIGKKETGEQVLVKHGNFGYVIASRTDYNRFLNVGAGVLDYYHGWSKVIQVMHDKCWCRNLVFKDPFIVPFYQILDTKDDYEDGC